MKKVLGLFLSAMLVMTCAAVSLAAITTTGEFDFDYFHNKNGTTDYTLAEVGLYNDITINDTTSAYLGLWLETDSPNNEQSYDAIDDAYIIKKLGAGSLKVGYGKYNIDGPLDVLGNSNFVQNLLGTSLEPAVQLLYTMPVNEEVTVKAGYFHDWYNWNTYKTYKTYTLQASYAKGALFGDATYLGIGKADGDAEDPSDEYIIDGGYKIGENYTVYASLVGANLAMSNTGGGLDETKNFVMLGATATYGNFFAEVEMAVSTPDDWYKNSDGDDANPFGFIIDYTVDANTKLRFARAINTGGLADFTKVQYIITF